MAIALTTLVAGVAPAASPAIEATLALPRIEPRHYVEAALALIDLGAPDQAGQIAGELEDLQLTDEALAQLVDTVGTARLTRLGRELPEAAGLVERALEAANTAATSPERLRGLVEQLGGERDEAVAAIRALRRTGVAGAAYCVEQIAASDDTKVRARLREALVALDPISQPAIFEATGSENEKVRTEAHYALGRLAELNRLRSPVAVALVAGSAFEPGPAGDAARWAYREMTGQTPSLAAAKSRLDSAIDELLAGAVLFVDGSAAPENLDVRLAARLAAERSELDPTNTLASRRARLLALETGDGADEAAVPVYEVSAVLADALDKGLHRAARLCCEALGKRGDLAALTASGGAESPLSRALEATHPAVRFAAAEAIVAINPQQPFAGSSRLADALLHFASATGDDVAVVAYPQLAKAGQTAGELLAAGYTATPANRGADAVRIATESPDTRLVLIDMSVSLPGARETLFRLRRSPATALVPVAVLAPDGRLAEAQRIAEEHDGSAGAVIAIARPHSPEATAALADRLVALAPAEWPDAEQRLAQAEAARAAIAKLVDEGPSFYALEGRSERVVSVAGFGVSDASLTTLVGLGTPESQLRLLDAASLEVRAIDDRNAAADAFTKSVREHGVLLTTDQIRRQYDRYNLSATAPEATQQVLGRLLDVLEGTAE